MKPIFVKSIFVFAILLASDVKVFGQKIIDPTGTYLYNGNTTKKGDDVYGYSGQIQVKALRSNKIVMTFEVNKGAPSYNSGSFVDTLNYHHNKAIYTASEDDSTCKITFYFDTKGITVKEETADFNVGCGFGHAVIADGRFRKISSRRPKLTEPLTGEPLE